MRGKRWEGGEEGIGNVGSERRERGGEMEVRKMRGRAEL